MSSFYPALNGGGGGGSESIDYNKIQNKPIIEVEGTEEVPTIISALASGNYLAKGYFKADPDSDLQHTSDALNITITYDSQTGKKVFSYITIKDGMPYMTIGTYDEEGKIESIEDIPLMQSSWSQF